MIGHQFIFQPQHSKFNFFGVSKIRGNFKFRRSRPNENEMRFLAIAVMLLLAVFALAEASPVKFLFPAGFDQEKAGINKRSIAKPSGSDSSTDTQSDSSDSPDPTDPTDPISG